MGIGYSTRFFYGIVYRVDDPVEKGYRDALVRSIIESSNIPLVGKDYDNAGDLELMLKWGDKGKALIEDIDKIWDNEGEPLFIYQKFFDGEEDFSFGIRETLQGISIYRGGLEFRQFDLEGIDTSVWDHLLKAKCVKYNLPWATPHFTLFLNYSESSTETDLFYGLTFNNSDILASHLLTEHDHIKKDWFGVRLDELGRIPYIDIKWDKKNDPICISRHRGAYQDFCFMGMRSIYYPENSSSFKITGLDTTRWDRLLKPYLELEGVDSRVPQFQIILTHYE